MTRPPAGFPGSRFQNLVRLLLGTVAAAGFVLTAPGVRAQEVAKTLEHFQRLGAEKFHTRLTPPSFETTPAAIVASTDAVLADADRALDRLGRPAEGSKPTFATTVGALDDVRHDVHAVGGRLGLIKETSLDPALRKAAEGALQRLQDWDVGADYREDVYRVIRAYAGTRPELPAEPARLLGETLRDFRRAGLDLPAGERRTVERERKELNALMTEFAANQANVKAPVTFSRAELAGVSETFLNDPKVKTGEDTFTVAAHETFQYTLVEDQARSEATRRRLYVAHDNLARERNEPLLNRILALRDSLARRLGYRSWADYQIEPRMARDAATAERFVDDLLARSQPKFDAEVAAMQALKAADTGDPQARIATWDWRYYQNQIRRTRYNFDPETLRVYFPFQKVLEGMFKVYEQNFGLRFLRVDPPVKWVDDLQLYVTTDAATGEPLGLFYLDVFPREGKFNHFAQFAVLDGKLLPDGTYQRPTSALLCNFPPPQGGNPSLLRHPDVVTLFHEFGHALHTMLTRARFDRFAGTNVPRDFVEAPSQMLENWAWDKTVLDGFAADYRDPSRKIPAETLDRMREARVATAGVHFRRQFAFAKLDLALHGPHPAGKPFDAVAVSNRALEEVFLPIDPGTAFAAGFGHLMGYDASYYGYPWAERVAADMATVFRGTRAGLLDRDAGMRLRREVYEPGNSRDVNESIERFLGRKLSTQPFLENNLGLKPAPGNRP